MSSQLYSFKVRIVSIRNETDSESWFRVPDHDVLCSYSVVMIASIRPSVAISKTDLNVVREVILDI